MDLQAAAPYELGQAPPPQIGTLHPAYVRGQAYLLAHNGAAAAAEFQKLLDHGSIVANFVTGALAHLQIGRAFPMAGETAKAKAAYLDFLILCRCLGRLETHCGTTPEACWIELEGTCNR